MAPSAVAVPHHHRNTTKSVNKAFKSKHLSKGALKDLSKGKIEERGSRKTPHQQLMSKLDRRNQTRQKQRLKHQNKSESVSIFSGQNGASRHVAVIPIADTVDTDAAIRSLNESLDIPETDIQGHTCRVRIERFKQNILYLPTKKDLISALDACRLADFVIFILPADDTLDEGAQLMLRAIEGQGISNVLAVTQGLEKIMPPKKRPQITASLKSFITHFFPTLDKVHSLDSRQECSNIVRGICTATPKGIRWRDDRSWMLIESIQWPESSSDASNEVVVTGVVRGRGLKADRLVHIPTWGDYKISSITAAPLPSAKQKKGDHAMNIDDTAEPQVLDQPSADCDDLATVAPEEVVMMDETFSLADTEKKGVLLDDYHYFSDGDDKHTARPRRLPKGTSDYQAAWYLDDLSDSGSDLVDEMDDVDEDMDLDTPAGPEDGFFNMDKRDAMTEAGGPSEYPQSEMFLDPSPEDEAQQIEEYRASRKNEAKEDLEFPDEIELHPSTIARERLARYRGLKSLKTSKWEMEEDRAHEPEDWRRLLQIVDYRGSKNQCLREALVGGVKPGSRVDVHLSDVPPHLRSLSSQPTSLFSLLRHEHKHAVVNINMTLNSTVTEPLKSKEELIIQCGPRRLMIKPLFSAAGNTPNNVHKFDRYLHPGRSAVATFIGPVSWGSIPVLVFKNTAAAAAADTEAMDSSADNGELDTWELIGTGTTMAPDHSRVVAKRVILTGHPYKIHKKVVTVRYMFFNAEDVNWFKALQLWTKRGRSGYIKESLGTHGYFKATFDAKINPQDAIGISLYKRVFPRKAVAWGEATH
ncbi:pre-rRNA processing protein Tsr1 [Blastomyces gilchristii SLH14081]|uniref:Pre-rRNA processing protein Tsr1 n=1 Tax=Blastomyces gilchristii (strain SLH14081) TaxID=559298 RepID=A0A179URJ0_BLAGS|nr:pre-rRNA processing protein Tsr1 [Blastomyces gilchristii SLH14081]OAT09849.1 pre-rRNA processing protein Tsr1 [Blastomyces gilchristii SLH14081]